MKEFPDYSPAPMSLRDVLAIRYPITDYSWFVSGVPYIFYFIRDEDNLISIIYRRALASDFRLLCSHVNQQTAGRRWEAFLQRMNLHAAVEV